MANHHRLHPSVALLAIVAVVASFATHGPVAATTIVCPQYPANNARMPTFCARNVYGVAQVSKAEFENWNCNHPFNRKIQIEKSPVGRLIGSTHNCSLTEYTFVSAGVCDPRVPAAPECVPATCPTTGTPVCAQLRSPDPRWKNSFTMAVFSNQCELTLYNCLNPLQSTFGSLYRERTAIRLRHAN